MPASKHALILFDIGNVLLKFDRKRAAQNFDRHHPGVGETLSALLFSDYIDDLETGRMTGRGLYSDLRRRHKIQMTYAQFRTAFSEIFTPIASNVRLLQSFLGTHAVAILSNTNDIHWKHMRRRYPFLLKVKRRFLSHKIGHSKPRRGAFEAVRRGTGVPFKKILFIDDRRDIARAARGLGITVIRFRGAGHLTGRLKKLGFCTAVQNVLP